LSYRKEFGVRFGFHRTWAAFSKVNNLHESGKLKEQKFSATDVARGTLALKEWHM